MTTLQNFYENEVVFITGGTGFLGKVLLGKLLLATEVQCIYLLIRSKQNKTTQERLKDMLQNELFAGLKNRIDSKNRHVLSKVKAVSGDCALPGLGLTEENRSLLVNNVTIVFNIAASVRFMEPLGTALKINVLSTHNCLKIAKQMTMLKSFVHVSTAFVHCHKLQIEECISTEHHNGLSGVNACKLIEIMDDKMMDQLTPTLLDKYPNTYTYTKSLAEDVVATEAHDMPISVFRPVAVVSSYSEPMPGWVDNLYGPLGLLQSIMMGFTHVLRYRRNQLAPLVPVDYCVNAMIATSYFTAHKPKNSNNSPKVFNYTVDTANPTTWGDYVQASVQIAKEHPTKHLIWYPFLFQVESAFIRSFLRTLLHIVPAFLVDLWGTYTCKKNKSFRSIYNRFHKANDLGDYFTMRDIHISNGNVKELWRDLSDDDKHLFPFDMKQVNWKQQHFASLMGLKRYMLHEGPDDIEIGHRLYAKFRRLHILVTCSLLCLPAFLLYYWFFYQVS